MTTPTQDLVLEMYRDEENVCQCCYETKETDQ